MELHKVAPTQEATGLTTMDRRQKSRTILEAMLNLSVVVEGLDRGRGKYGSSSLRKAQEISLYLVICENSRDVTVKTRGD